MQGRTAFACLALSCATLCQACSTDAYRPAPVPAAVETVTVYRDLPDTLLTPCAKPHWDTAEIETDIDLLGLAARMSDALDRCAAQLDGIRAVYREVAAP